MVSKVVMQSIAFVVESSILALLLLMLCTLSRHREGAFSNPL